jgi:hypothetical protein
MRSKLNARKRPNQQKYWNWRRGFHGCNHSGNLHLFERVITVEFATKRHNVAVRRGEVHASVHNTFSAMPNPLSVSNAALDHLNATISFISQ